MQVFLSMIGAGRIGKPDEKELKDGYYIDRAVSIETKYKIISDPPGFSPFPDGSATRSQTRKDCIYPSGLFSCCASVSAMIATLTQSSISCDCLFTRHRKAASRDRIDRRRGNRAPEVSGLFINGYTNSRSTIQSAILAGDSQSFDIVSRHMKPSTTPLS